jgi:DNA-binding NtrC family response regulator
LEVAGALHGAGPDRSGRLIVVHCGRDADMLEPALCSWLSLDGGGSPSERLHAGGRGTLFLDEVRLLREPEQRLLLALALQLQDGSPAGARERGPSRLIAGDTEELLVATREGRFSATLLDALDKIRVELGGALGRGAA